MPGMCSFSARTRKLRVVQPCSRPTSVAIAASTTVVAPDKLISSSKDRPPSDLKKLSKQTFAEQPSTLSQAEFEQVQIQPYFRPKRMETPRNEDELRDIKNLEEEKKRKDQLALKQRQDALAL